MRAISTLSPGGHISQPFLSVVAHLAAGVAEKRRGHDVIALRFSTAAQRMASLLETRTSRTSYPFPLAPPDNMHRVSRDTAELVGELEGRDERFSHPETDASHAPAGRSSLSLPTHLISAKGTSKTRTSKPDMGRTLFSSYATRHAYDRMHGNRISWA